MRLSKIRTFIAFTLVVGFIAALHVFGFLREIEGFLRKILNPVSGTIYTSALSGKMIFSSKEELIAALDRANAEADGTLVDNARLYFLEKENEELRKQLNFFSKAPISHVGVRVIGKNIEPHANTILLDQGSAAGISIGDPVIVGQGILAGKVVRVERETSVAQLLSDQRSKVAAIILNDEESPGIIEGGYKISVRMNYIPQNETVKVGDVIATSGLEERIPRGLVIGTVEAVIKEPHQPFQQAVIAPASPLEEAFAASVLITRTAGI